MNQKDIIQLESSNKQQAYVFEENGQWYAYERSANRIERFVKGFVNFAHKMKDVRGCMKVEIDFRIVENCPIASCEDSIIVLNPTA